ncbi:MAG: hypothetical protein HMLIMOIP_001723 [Candidatus Nitrosomirales archaeon]|jgi:hypothetical protein
MGKLDYVSEIGQELSGKKGTVTLSCRLDKTLYDMLQSDSKKKGISLNSLINSIANRYISWERYAAEVGFIPLAKETVRLIFESLEEKKMYKIAEHLGRTIPKELILLMFNKIDFDSIVAFLEITSSRYGMVQHSNGGNYHDLILYHDVNEKFSRFLCESLRVMAEDLSFKADILNADSKILRIRIGESCSVK